MPATPNQNGGKFVVAVPVRADWYNGYAQVLSERGRLRFYALGTRRGTPEVPPGQTRLNPWIGLCSYAANRVLSHDRAEAFRFALLPWFDRWVLKQLQPGDHIISSYGFTNACFRFARQHGGHAILDAGNSHIENFWEIMTEEHRRWNCPGPPIPKHWYERGRAMMSDVDFVLSPSAYVTQSFLSRGFKPEQIIPVVFPVNLSLFQPSTTPRPKDRPLTIINTGILSLRKGTPYLLEAVRIVRRTHPTARLLLNRYIRGDAEAVLARYGDLPIEWSPNLPHELLAERLRGADVFVLPSLEEGLVRTALEAMACGLQAVLTPNTGANDFIQPGVNGEVVPIRDPAATAEAILKCWERARLGPAPKVAGLHEKLSFEAFAKGFAAQLAGRGWG